MNLDSARIAASRYVPPRHIIRIETVEAHTGGEPLRVIVGGWPNLMGETVLERRRYCFRHFDHLRRAIMLEPRGHADMYGCLVMPPVSDSADFSVLFMHNEGYSTMCGHGIIAVSKVAVDLGFVDVESRIQPAGSAILNPGTGAGATPEHVRTPQSATESATGGTDSAFPGAMSAAGRGSEGPAVTGACPITIDTPAGLVRAVVHLRSGVAEEVSFANVPSFVDTLDAEVEVRDLGRIRYDLAFGGAYYAYVKAAAVDVTMDPSGYRDLIAKGMAIKHAVMDSKRIDHPSEPDLGFLYGTIFVGDPVDSANHSRNVCVFADGEVDRSPTGTGVSGRAAIMYARGELAIGESVVIESILGTTFSVRVDSETKFGEYSAVVPIVSGTAAITGRSEMWIDHVDPLREGFMLR